MNKNNSFRGILLLIPISAILLFSFSGGINGPRTGSPGDGGNTCTQCHFPGANFSAAAEITTNIPAGGYALGETYQITVNGTSSGAAAYGFQITAERNSDNTKVGFFTESTGTVTQDGGTRVSHSSRNPSGTWTFDWTAPSSDEGDITFYTAVNAVNSNGGTTGDQVVTASQPIGGVLSVAENTRLNFEMYPNPALNEFNIQLATGTDTADVEVYDVSGRRVATQKVTQENKEVNIQNLSSGMYIVKVAADGKVGTQQFIKQ